MGRPDTKRELAVGGHPGWKGTVRYSSDNAGSGYVSFVEYLFQYSIHLAIVHNGIRITEAVAPRERVSDVISRCGERSVALA